MSKGGDSSNSASAQTPSQWASALTNASISAWKEADILSFSVAQLQALSPGQISNISVPWAVPMAVWTADTLNAVPLQYWSQWGTRYLSTTSNGVTSITPLSQSSNGAVSGKNNWFDDVGRGAAGFAFTPSTVAGISNDRIAQIGAGLGRNKSQAPLLPTNAGYVSPSDFTAALSAATASGANVVTWHISASQTAYMFASGWADMGADFMGALTYSQLGAIAHPESALGAAQFGYLSANQLTALGQMDWSKVTSAQLNATKISAFQGLQSHILQVISAQTWAGLDRAHTTALNAADVQLLPATTIAQMNYFGYALTASVGAVLSAAQVASIPSACWAQISDSQFLNSLSSAAFQAIPVSAFASMVDAVVGSLDHVHVAALTANQAKSYPLSKLSDASSALYQNPNILNFATFVAQSNVNWALAPARFIKLLTSAQLRLISPVQIAALSPTALSALTRAQTQALSLAQIQALSARQLSAIAYISRRTDVVPEIFGASQLVQLSLSFWGNVDSHFLNALALNAFQAITTAQLQAISAGAFANLDQAHVSALTGTQLLALTAEQVGQFNGAYLSIAFLRGVRLAAFKGLLPEQMHRLHDYLFNTVVSSAFDTTDPTRLQNAENQFASLLASILDSDDGREVWLQQSVTLLIQLRWLDATAAANLSASDVSTTYSALNWSWMSGTFLNSISTVVFAQLQASSVAKFNLTALAELDDVHLQALTVTQASALSGAQLSAIGHLGALSASVVRSLSATQLAGIHQDWSQISANFLNNMTASQFMNLPPTQFGQLTAAQLATTAIDWRLISPAQLNALSLSDFEELCTGTNPTILNTTVGVLLGLGGEQTAILARAATHYSAAQMNTLLNRLFGAFSSEQTSRLVDLMKKDSAEQIVLQTGLVALLAKIDGTTDGIEAAIQTMVSLRKMQPTWFSAANLSTVLPELSRKYTSYLLVYRTGITAENMHNYVFLTQTWNELWQTWKGGELAAQSRTSLAVATSLNLGNLLVILGVSIKLLARAIGAGVNEHWKKKEEREDFIAVISLFAIVSVSQALQLGVTLVLQALIQHYTGKALLNAIPAEVERRIAQAFQQQLPEVAVEHLRARATAPVDLPVRATPSPVSVMEVISQPPREQTPPVFKSPAPSDVPERPPPVLDLSQPAANKTIVIDRINPVDVLPPMLADTQFHLPLTGEITQAKAGGGDPAPASPKLHPNYSNNNNSFEWVEPRLLGVNKGVAILMINTRELPFTAQFKNLAHTDAPLLPQELHQVGVTEASVWKVLGDYQQAKQPIIFNASGKYIAPNTSIDRVIFYNMSGNSPREQTQRMRACIEAATSGQRNVSAGRFVLSNLERFVYSVWTDARTSANPPTHEDLTGKMGEMIKTLLGLSALDGGLDVAGVDGAMVSVNQQIRDTLTLIQEGRYAHFMVADAIVHAVSGPDTRSLTPSSLLLKVQQELRSQGIVQALDMGTLEGAKIRLVQSYAIETVSKQWVESTSDYPSMRDARTKMTLSELDNKLVDELQRVGIADSSASGERARNQMLVALLMDGVTKRASSLHQILEIYARVDTENLTVLLDDWIVKSYLSERIERIASERLKTTAVQNLLRTEAATSGDIRQFALGLDQQFGKIAEHIDLTIEGLPSYRAMSESSRGYVRKELARDINTRFMEKALTAWDKWNTDSIGEANASGIKLKAISSVLTHIQELRPNALTSFALRVSPVSGQTRFYEQFVAQISKANAHAPTLHLAPETITLSPPFEKTVAEQAMTPTSFSNANNNSNGDLSQQFAKFLAELIVSKADVLGRVEDAYVESMNSVLDKLRNGDVDTGELIEKFATRNELTIEGGTFNKVINLTADSLALAIQEKVAQDADSRGVPVPKIDLGRLSELIDARLNVRDFIENLTVVLQQKQAPKIEAADLFGARGGAEPVLHAAAAEPAPARPAPNLPAPEAIEVLRAEGDPIRVRMRQAGIANARMQLGGLKVVVMNYGILGFALFSSLIGVAAGLAGIIYAAKSTTLSWQIKALVLAISGVRVLSSGVMLVASGAQIVANVVKGVQVAADATKIANAGFAIGNVVGITTNIAQIGIQAKTLESATDNTSRLIAGLSILDSLLQLILNVVGSIALAFGPEGMVINFGTFIISALLPMMTAIVSAVEYRQIHGELMGHGLYKEAEIMYMNWQIAAMDASPIVNWMQSIYTEEMKKAQERKMDHAWMDQSAEERLLYSLRSSTTLKDNFDSLRAQIYAGAVALTQPLGNLSQTLTRATMLMLSQDNLSYFEGDKQATVKLAGTLNYSTNTVSRAPKLLGANVNGQVLSLVFNQDLANLGSQLPNLSSFSVLVNGTAVTVSGLAVLNNVVTLSLATAVTAGQSVTFSYSDPTAGNDSKAVQNVLGVDAVSIINHSVVNGLDSDKRAPKLADAVAQDNLLTLVFDEALSTAADNVPEKGAFSVLVNGSAVHIYNLGVHDQRVLLSLDDPIAVGATVTVSYNASYGDGGLQDAAGNRVASLNAQRVDNTGATSTVTASRVGWLQYDNFVSSVQGTGTEAASVLNGDDYTVYANAADATNGTSRLRYLSLSNAAGEFDMLSVTRAVDNSDRIWLDASNAQGVNNFAINTHDMTVWGGQGKNSYSLARPYAAQSYIVAANAWSDRNNVISISGSASDTSKKVNLDYFLSADNISAGLPVTQTAFTVLGANDGLDVVVGSGDNQSYMATSNVANINLTGANANVSVGESAQVNVGVNGRVQVDMDMWRGLNVEAPTAGVFNGVIKGNYGSYSLLNFAPTDSLNANFNGKLNLSYQIGHLPRLDAFSVYVGSTLVGVNSLSVNGKTLTLNLSSAVAQNEVVSVSYADVSSADDDNTLQGLTGKDVNSFSRQAVVNTTADTTAPKLAVATVQGNSLIVHFSEALQQSYRPLNSAWSVYVGGNRVAVNTVAFNDTSSLRLTLASAVAAGQTVSLNYSAASDTSVAVQDLAGNVTSSFSSASVINLANVTQAPNLRTVTANGNVLTLTFDGTVRYSLSNPSAFVVTANNTPLNISGVSVAGNSVLLSLSSAVSSGQLIEVSYSPPQQLSDATTLRDWLGNTVGSISAQVANNITGQDLTPPSLQYAVANGTSLVLTFSEALNNQAGFTPLPSGFAVNVNGKAVNVTQAVVSGSSVTLTLATAANYGDTMTLSYSDLSTGNDAAVVQDVAGNDAASFANVHVINHTPDTTPPSLLSATVKGNQLSLLFSESLNASSGYLPALTRMAVKVNGVAVSISAGNVKGSTATLTLGTAVNAGDYVTFNYTAPSNANDLQAFQDGAGNDLLSIANFNVTNSTGSDVTPPSLVSAQVNGTVLTLTFSEALASTASFTPGASAFTVSVNGSSATVSGVRLNGTQAVLTLASAVDSTAKVTVGYVRPSDASSTQAIQDGAQNMAASFSAQSVSNVTADTAPPSLSSASVAGAIVTLTFSENLATTPTLLASANQFVVTVDGQAVDVLSAVSSGNSVSITLSKAVTASQKVSVDYTVSTSGSNTSSSNVLQDSANNKTANFSRTVQNLSGLASIQNATVNGATVSLIFNQELDANSTHLPPLSAFAVKVNGVSSAVSNLAVNGHVVTLTLGAAVTAGQKVTVNYTSTDNDLTALQNRGGMDVQSFSAPYAVHNLSVAPEAATPSLSNAKVNGSTLTLTFSEALDAGVGEWWVNYLPDGLYDASGNPVVTSRIKASGFVNVLGSNSNDSFIIGDQSGLDVSRQLDYVQLGNGQGVQVNYYDTSGNLFLAMGNKGQANVILESGSSLQKLLTTKLVQSDADIAHFKANRDTVTLKSLSSLTAFLSGYETIDATDSTSRLSAEIGEGDHQIKLGGQTVHLEFDKVASTTSISTRQIPNSWLDEQYFNFKGMNADGLWVGRESDGTVLFRAQWKDSASGGTDNKLNVSYDGTLSNVVFEVGNVVSGSKTSQLRLDKLIEAMSAPAFSTDPNAASHAMTDADTATKLYRITDIVAYSAASQPTVSGGV